MKKNFKKDFKPNKFQKREKPSFNFTNEEIENINPSSIGDALKLKGIVDSIEQTGGPTIFNILDGTGTLPLKAFEGAGERAYPEINVGDVVDAKIIVQEYQGEIEGDVKSLSKLPDEMKIEINNKISDMQRQRAKPSDVSFLIKDPILDKLKDRFMKAAEEVRLAIIQNRPIIVRHHNDTDGYSSGYALERAILPLVTKQHSSLKAAWEFYVRAPVSAPMYEIDDSIRDTAKSLSNAAKFSNKMPLVLIVDTGSGEKDLLGIQQGKVHGMDFIVVDHHAFDKDLISEQTLVHINPFLVGEEGTKFSAGMLCTEFARFINEDENLNIKQIPAMAGIADKINNESAMNQYLEIAKNKGYDKEHLTNIAKVIDFVSAKLRFMEAREYIEVLFGEPMEKQQALVNLLAPYISMMTEKGLEIAKSAVKKENLGKTNIQILEIEKVYPRGFYPKPGMCVSIIHDYANKYENVKNLVTLGIMPDAVTIRASDDSPFSIQQLGEYLEKNIPEAFTEGGGHKHAGSYRFIPIKEKEVLEKIKEYIKSL
jgi:RecJ-like exonuclease